MSSFVIVSFKVNLYDIRSALTISPSWEHLPSVSAPTFTAPARYLYPQEQQKTSSVVLQMGNDDVMSAHQLSALYQNLPDTRIEHCVTQTEHNLFKSIPNVYFELFSVSNLRSKRDVIDNVKSLVLST